MNKVRFAFVSLLVLSLVASSSIAAALGSEGGFSGDDAYDPAAGGLPGLVVASPAVIAAALGSEGGFSGDDAYDPAAGGAPWLSVAPPAVIAGGESTDYYIASFSGDDLYDPAAGGLPVLVVAPPAVIAGGESTDYYIAESGSLAACSLLDEVAARSGLRVEGGFSGDDAYDPAAGGVPDLFATAYYAAGSGSLVACDLSAITN